MIFSQGFWLMASIWRISCSGRVEGLLDPRRDFCWSLFSGAECTLAVGAAIRACAVNLKYPILRKLRKGHFKLTAPDGRRGVIVKALLFGG